MREILFRGKRIDESEWVQGDAFTNLDGKVTGIINGFGLNKIHYETVSQYTGLKDSTGKRIFEGDIVKFKLQDADEYRFAKILYGEFVDENDSQFYLGFYVVGMGCTFSIFNGKDEGYDFIGMCEVCGNIHDNPELLEAL